MSDCLGAAAEIIERQIGRLRRSVLKSGAATIEGVHRYQSGAQLHYELLLVVTPGWVTAPAVPPDDSSRACGQVSEDANVARMQRVLNPWLKTTALAAGSVAEVVRCDLTQAKTERGLPPECTVQIVVRVPNAARVGVTRTTRAVSAGGFGLPLREHVQSAVSGEA